MNFLETILSSGDGAVVKQLAGQFGITSDQAVSSVSAMLPALAGGVKERLASGDSSGLTKVLSDGSLTKFADNPATLGSPAAIEQGKSLLSQMFGAQDLTGIVSGVAEKAGVSSTVVSSLLPIGATLLGALLSKNAAAGHNLSDAVGQFANLGHSGILDSVKTLTAKMFG